MCLVNILNKIKILKERGKNEKNNKETWRIQAHLPSGHTVYQFIDDWVKETNVMLGGRLTLELYPAKAIIPPFETLEAVQMGIIDADITSPAYFAGRDPAIPLLADLIGAYSNWFEKRTLSKNV